MMSEFKPFIRETIPKDDFSLIMGFIQDAACSISMNSKHYIKGGWVRDLLRGVPPSDMDLFIPSPKSSGMISAFIEKLKSADRLRKYIEIPQANGYSGIILEVQTNTGILKLDISYRNGCFGENMLYNEENCDFTCNNLTMNPQGQIGFRIPPPKSLKGISEAQWLARCIHDAMAGRLVWIVPDKFINKNPLLLQLKMRERLAKMKSKGFIETGESLTRFKLATIRNYLDIPAIKDATCCSICHEDFADKTSKTNIALACDHPFHEECIKKWLLSNSENRSNCPTCRQIIDL